MLFGAAGDSVCSSCHALAVQEFITQANAGNLPVLQAAHIVLKKNEIAHLEISAQLLKEVHRTTRSYSGYSFRIASGLYYHTGRSKPLTRSSIELDDQGLLTATSQRIVFVGARRGVEIKYEKLLSVTTFSDAIEFHVSNRQGSPLFAMAEGWPHILASVVNGAVRKYNA